MRCIHVTGWEEAANELSRRLTEALGGGQRVLWLVPGGSNIAAAVEIMKNLPAALTDRLTVTLTDERYGPVGHRDSNWGQLLAAGFDAKKARLLPVLQADQDLAQTVEHYHQLAERAFSDNDVVIALFGIGADGHIAGILPESPAAHEDKRLAAGYDSPPYQRLTLTFPALKRIDTAYAFAFGESKRAALSDLQARDIPLAKQPAQILKRLPEAYVYNDQVGDSA